MSSPTAEAQIPEDLFASPALSWRRRVRRAFHRHKPLAVVTLLGLLVLAGPVLDLLGGGTRRWLEEAERNHSFAVGLVQNGLITAFAAALAYYLLRGLRCDRALTAYRARAEEDPEAFVGGFVDPMGLVRRGVCEGAADLIAMSPEPSLLLVQGRSSADRTGFVAGLTSALARHDFVPVPVSAPGSAALDLSSLARRCFYDHIDPSLTSESEADAVWRRARWTHDLVILVDGLDEEAIDELLEDDGDQLSRKLKELLTDGVGVVLVSAPRQLVLGDLPIQTEQLDVFARDEAEEFLRKHLPDKDAAHGAVGVLKPLNDPIGGFELDPFYLEVLVRLRLRGDGVQHAPSQRDRWRAEVLGAYTHAVDTGDVKTGRRAFDALHVDERKERGRTALEAAKRMAKALPAHGNLVVSDDATGQPHGTALKDAEALRLLSCGTASMAFPSDDLAAFLLASATGDWRHLLEPVTALLDSSRPLSLADRRCNRALIFWHILHDGASDDAFQQLVRAVYDRRLPRPGVVATAVRIAAACQLPDDEGRLANAATSSLDWLAGGEGLEVQRPDRARELVGLARALSDWPCEAAHRILWRLATKRDIEVEWPAAKALALAQAKPHATLAGDFEEAIRTAERIDRKDLSKPHNVPGDTLGSLAWVLPAMRKDQAAAEQLERVSELCLSEETSPLRGEMSLAQGLKLALVNKRAVGPNVEDVRRRLCDGDLRFWHARLVLVQAILVHAWEHPAAAPELAQDLERVNESEKHPFVKTGIALAHAGLRVLGDPKRSGTRLGDYAWTHERDAVRWVEQRRPLSARLLADTVLLSNMLYRLREAAGATEQDSADELATSCTLPRCIRVPAQRRNIDNAGCANDRCNNHLCTRWEESKEAVLMPRAEFSESFCREQARLAARHAIPQWTRRAPTGRRKLKAFWETQAKAVREKPH